MLAAGSVSATDPVVAEAYVPVCTLTIVALAAAGSASVTARTTSGDYRCPAAAHPVRSALTGRGRGAAA